MIIPKQWNVLPKAPEEIFNQFPEINPIIVQLLFNRGIIDQQNIDAFLGPEYSDNLHDPFLFKDMDKAVDRILKAIERGEKILVYGDYDADGVTSSAVMTECLKMLGATAAVYIPFRETEGYGINQAAAQDFIKQKIQLIITVDCGVADFNEIKLMTDNGVDVIITDHHQPPTDLPPALAIINPNIVDEAYPFKKLAGVGVAFKVAQALISRHHQYKVKTVAIGQEKWLLDLAAIGTIADMVPLLGENRVLVRYGLLVLKKTRRPGLLALLNNTSSFKKIDEQLINWQVAPRLNAAGRMNHASVAYQLLVTDDAGEAQQLSQELNEANKNRQQLTERIKAEALESIGDIDKKNILVAIGDNWPTGVVGLVAGKIMDLFHKPTLVISHFNGEIIGSGRSLAGFNITDALHSCEAYLKKFGGHAQACGFTIKSLNDVEGFIAKMQEMADRGLSGKKLVPQLKIEVEVNLAEVNWQLFESLQQFSPYGEKNPKPKFLVKNLSVADCQALGGDGQHMRLMVKQNVNVIKKTIGFSMGEWCAKLKNDDKIDMVFEVDINEWNGNRELQLKIIDLKLSEND